MIIDEAEIYIKAGRGGDGAVSFRRERYVPKGGPDGGDGGDGGDVILVADRHVSDLSEFNSKTKFLAENGRAGMGKKKSGKSGEDLYLHLPLGTQIFNRDELIYDFVTDGEERVIAKGGQGGWGNWHFSSSIKQTPMWSKSGLPGEGKKLRFELKTIADIGIIGMPNAGKSTLLSTITNAKPKIADYPFTTLEPNLGAIKLKDKTLILADIPGLISGAHTGRGLGDKFLKHIERTKVLLHLIDAGSEDIVSDYKMIRDELAKFSPALAKKKEIVAISKIDSVDEIKLKDQITQLKTLKITPIAFSSSTNKNLKTLLSKILK